MSADGLAKDLVAASAVPLLLSILRQGDSYGYEIIGRVKEVSGGRIEWSEGMLYPVLHRLTSLGFLEPYWKQAETGRRRKYYRLTDSGAAELERSREEWAMVNRTIETLGETDV